MPRPFTYCNVARRREVPKSVRNGVGLKPVSGGKYLDTVFAAIPVVPFTAEMARIAAKVDADAKKSGSVIPFADLPIGSTALHFGFAIETRNLRHFQMIPGLKIVPL